MYYSSRKGSTTSATRRQASVLRTTATTRFDDASPSGNETDGGSAELLNISTSREDLSRAASRCSCHSGESNNQRIDTKDGAGEYSWTSTSAKLEFDHNAGSEDELLKEELLRIFDREKFGLESYFKQKTESILHGYRRKQSEWEENLRLEKIEYEKNLAQEKIELQQNYISEMTKLTKQFNQERVELESHYKKQISELTQQFEMRKKEMDETIIKERTELKLRLESEYQSMLTAQRTADEQRFRQQRSELEEDYKKKILDLEQKLKESSSESELAGRRMQADLEAKFEGERTLLVVEWRKRVELLEIELGKERERANKEERKACESHGFLRTEMTKKEAEIEKLRQSIDILRAEISKKEKTAKEFETLQQNIFLRGSDALPGKLRDDFEKMLAEHRQELERTLRKEREGQETERERRVVLERETLEKQMKMERERMTLEMEKEREEMRRVSREKEERLRGELRQEMEILKTALENEKTSLREHVRDELGKEKIQIGERFLKEKDERSKEMERFLKQKDERNKEMERFLKQKDERSEEAGRFLTERNERSEEMQRQQSRKTLDSQEERRGSERQDYEQWVANQKMEHTKQWVEGQYRATSGNKGPVEENRRSEPNDKRSEVLPKEGNRSMETGPLKEFPDYQGDTLTNVSHRSNVEEKNVTNVMVNVDVDKNSEYSVHALEQENHGLKAKVAALQENIHLHECYKTEASEEIERLRKMNKELKVKLQQAKEKLSEYEERLEDSQEKIKEYEEICEDYEECLKECRTKIMVIEKDRQTSRTIGRRPDDGRKDDRSSKDGVEGMSREPRRSRDKQENKDIEDGYQKGPSPKYMERDENNDPVVDILRTEKKKLEGVVQDLEGKIRLLEKKISEISTVSNKTNNADHQEKSVLKSNLERVQRQNRDLVNKVKDLQFQLQGMVDKLRKEKKKVTALQAECRSFKSTHQAEIRVLQEKLEYSGKVIERLQTASAESSVVNKLQDEITMISKLIMEERLSDQRMLRARSVEELEKFRELDREKGELERKLQDARVAMDVYSDKLKNKASYTELASSQLSLNTGGDSFLRDMRLSKTLRALEESQRTSLRQNERLLHEKKELQSLIGRLCKSQEDLRSFGGSRLSLSSCGSSTSSLSTSSLSSEDFEGGRTSGLRRDKFSSTFSFYD